MLGSKRGEVDRTVAFLREDQGHRATISLLLRNKFCVLYCLEIWLLDSEGEMTASRESNSNATNDGRED